MAEAPVSQFFFSVFLGMAHFCPVALTNAGLHQLRASLPFHNVFNQHLCVCGFNWYVSLDRKYYIKSRIDEICCSFQLGAIPAQASGKRCLV